MRPASTQGPTATAWRHYAEYHRPRVYRYRVADPGLRLRRNRYTAMGGDDSGAAWIGLCLVVGRYAYCMKWANARMRCLNG